MTRRAPRARRFCGHWTTSSARGRLRTVLLIVRRCQSCAGCATERWIATLACEPTRRHWPCDSRGSRVQPLNGIQNLLVGAVGEHVNRATAREAAFAAMQPDLGALACVDIAQGLRYVMQFE
jgi:hypothetical protein